MKYFNTDYYQYPAIYIIMHFLLVMIVCPVFSFAQAWPVKLLWNWLMPVIFSLPTITFWQAAGLMLLISLLFRWSISFAELTKKEKRDY